jgi:hypothetical protein
LGKSYQYVYRKREKILGFPISLEETPWKPAVVYPKPKRLGKHLVFEFMGLQRAGKTSVLNLIEEAMSDPRLAIGDLVIRRELEKALIGDLVEEHIRKEVGRVPTDLAEKNPDLDDIHELEWRFNLEKLGTFMEGWGELMELEEPAIFICERGPNDTLTQQIPVKVASTKRR